MNGIGPQVPQDAASDDDVDDDVGDEDEDEDASDSASEDAPEDTDDDAGADTPPTPPLPSMPDADEASAGLRQKRDEDVKKGKAIAKQLASHTIAFTPSRSADTDRPGAMGFPP
jgi:protein AATF/BFR2